jgi:hypothetical protein
VGSNPIVSTTSLQVRSTEHVGDLADLAGHTDARTTQGYRHAVRPSLPHAIDAWDRLLDRADSGSMIAR